MSVLEFFTGFITLSEDPFQNWMLGVVLLSVSGSVAYAIGGRLGYRGKSGWWLWLIAAIAVYAVIACVIRAALWLIALPWWIWAIVGSVILVAAIIAVVVVWDKKAGGKK